MLVIEVESPGKLPPLPWECLHNQALAARIIRLHLQLCECGLLHTLGPNAIAVLEAVHFPFPNRYQKL